jgi:hypothetical protein
VDQPADVELCLELGVDAIITNRPAEVVGRLRTGTRTEQLTDPAPPARRPIVSRRSGRASRTL